MGSTPDDLPRAPLSLEGNPAGFLYVADAAGKKILNLLGTEERKLALGSWIVESYNREATGEAFQDVAIPVVQGRRIAPRDGLYRVQGRTVRLRAGDILPEQPEEERDGRTQERAAVRGPEQDSERDR